MGWIVPRGEAVRRPDGREVHGRVLDGEEAGAVIAVAEVPVCGGGGRKDRGVGVVAVDELVGAVLEGRLREGRLHSQYDEWKSKMVRSH